MATLICIIVLFICVITPALLTIFNIINLFKKKKIKENIIDVLTFGLGIGLTGFLYLASDFRDYTEALRLGGLEIDKHAPIASWSMPTVLAIFILGLVSYFLIRRKKLNLPPLIVVCAMSGIIICSIYMIIFMIQITVTDLFTRYLFYGIPYLLLFPINYILCSIRAEIEIMKKYKEQNRIRQQKYREKLKSEKEESNVTQTSSNVEEENITEENKIENNRLEDDIKAGENGSGFKTIDF